MRDYSIFNHPANAFAKLQHVNACILKMLRLRPVLRALDAKEFSL